MHLLCACFATVSTAFYRELRNLTAGLIVAVMYVFAFLYTKHARRSLRLHKSLWLPFLSETLVLMPIDHWSSITKKGLGVALQLRGEVRIVQVNPDHSTDIERDWQRNVVDPLRSAGKKLPELVVLQSSQKHALSPMAEYVLEVERTEPDRQIVVVVPELAVRHWWQKPLHNYRNRFLKSMLYARGSRRIMIIDVPWFL